MKKVIVCFLIATWLLVIAIRGNSFREIIQRTSVEDNINKDDDGKLSPVFHARKENLLILTKGSWSYTVYVVCIVTFLVVLAMAVPTQKTTYCTIRSELVMAITLRWDKARLNTLVSKSCPVMSDHTSFYQKSENKMGEFRRSLDNTIKSINPNGSSNKLSSYDSQKHRKKSPDLRKATHDPKPQLETLTEDFHSKVEFVKSHPSFLPLVRYMEPVPDRRSPQRFIPIAWAENSSNSGRNWTSLPTQRISFKTKCNQWKIATLSQQSLVTCNAGCGNVEDESRCVPIQPNDLQSTIMVNMSAR